MITLVALGVVPVLIILPATLWITLGVLALWDSLRPPKLWQVIAATAFAGFLPMLAHFLNKLIDDFSAPGTGSRIQQAFSYALLSYLPILVPGVLWALQRPRSDGFRSLGPRVARSVLIAYAILVTLVLPVTFYGFILYHSGYE